MDKFAGVGMFNILIIWACVTVISVIAKTLAAQYHIDGLSDVILAS